MKKLAYCRSCTRSLSHDVPNYNPYASPDTFEYLCSATKLFVKCVDRNKKGVCKYYNPVEGGNIYG